MNGCFTEAASAGSRTSTWSSWGTSGWRLRTVSNSGQDAFWPSSPLVITSANSAATAWPLALAQAVNAANGAVRVGVLNTQNQVVPQQNATSNHVYAQTSADIASAFLQRVPASSETGGVTVTPVVASSSAKVG